MFGFANELVDYSIEQVKAVQFCRAHKVDPKFFTRASPLNFKNTSLIILNMVKRTVAVEVMNYFNHTDVVLSPSRQAFSEAREKIKYTAFKELFDKSCELAADGGEDARLFKGHRLFAVDGTSFMVGELSKLKDFFGESTTVKGKAMCRISGVVDVLNECVVDAAVSPFSTGERALAIGQVEKLKPVSNALYLFDRGYWSPELIQKIIGNGQKFLMRLASNAANAPVKGDNGNEYELRKYSFALPDGNVEHLATNISEQDLSDEDLARLYAKRWGVETKYLELKEYLQIDALNSNSSNIALQDIYATLYISNLVAFLCWEADEIIKKKTDGKSNKHRQKANRAVCIAALRRRFVPIFLLGDSLARQRELERFFLDVSKNVTYIGKSKPKPRGKSRFDKRLRKSSAFVL